MKIDLKRLKYLCNAKIESFEDLGEVTTGGHGLNYVFVDNGADILAVAHLDSVGTSKKFRHRNKNGLQTVQSQNLDDRLGVYVLLDMLPKMGIKYDLLLTDGEEYGMSSALWFETDKEYKWMFQFDREGTDVVMYDFLTDKLVEEFEKFGLDAGYGLLSDITYLEHLGCKGFNFGTAYYRSHSKKCFVVLNQLTMMVDIFETFYKTHKDTHFPHEESQWSIRGADIGYGYMSDPRAHTYGYPDTSFDDRYSTHTYDAKKDRWTKNNRTWSEWKDKEYQKIKRTAANDQNDSDLKYARLQEAERKPQKLLTSPADEPQEDWYDEWVRAGKPDNYNWEATMDEPCRSCGLYFPVSDIIAEFCWDCCETITSGRNGSHKDHDEYLRWLAAKVSRESELLAPF